MKMSTALAGVGQSIVSTVSGLTVTVAPFRAGVFSSLGGTLALLPSGTWFVGVDLFTGAVIALPRLGHRGWVPVARVVTGTTSVTSISQITPELPASRIPRTLKKIMDGQAISVLVMGSSLTQSGGSGQDWPSMLFAAGASLTAYRVPGTITVQYCGVGGAPNQYQLAQTGLGGFNGSMTYDDAGSPVQATNPNFLPSDRSNLFDGVDLVVLGCLANGGDYRLDCIEPTVRNLRKMGVEVILVSDDAQIGTPYAQTYAALTAAGLYVDGPVVKRIADLYGCEFADTAAYVVDATLRYPTNGAIYGLNDSIHMSNALPAGRTATPSCGHEMWARAVRSVIPIDGQPAAPVTLTYDFSTGLQGWTAFSAANVDASSGALVVTKNTAATNQWGGWIQTLPQIYVGDTVRVRGTASGTSGNGTSIGLQYSGWASNSVGFGDGAFDVTLTCTANSTALLFYGGNNAAANGAAFTVDNLIIDILHVAGSQTDLIPSRPVEARALPPSRVVTDMKTPGDAHIVLPANDQFIISGNELKGTLGAHPWGSSSFARRFCSAISSTTDLLTVAAGQSCGFAASAVVGLSVIRFSDPATDSGCTVDVYRNGAKIKTLTFTAAPFANEWYSTIFTPTELAQGGIGSITSVTLAVTAGTLKVAAFVALTAEIEFVPLEGINFVGSWPFTESDGGTGTRGRATDTVADYAWLKCPPTARRVQWLLACRSNSQPVNIYSGKSSALNVATNGVNHFRAKGGLIGPGAVHSIKPVSAAASPVVGNRSLHVSGAVIIYDR